MSVQRSITYHSTQFKHTNLFIDLVLNSTHAGTLVLVQLVLIVLVTSQAVGIFYDIVLVNGLDDVRQHQHVLFGLTLPRVGQGSHTRADSTHSLLEHVGTE